MKKQLFLGLVLAALTLLPCSLFAQSTEGTDFWVTLMRGDSRSYDELSLTFSANKATSVRVMNTETGLDQTINVGDKAIEQMVLNNFESSCYVTDEHQEQPVYRALHITSEKPISLIAANYKNKSFDVAAILPTAALKSEYRIQCYTPSAHKEDDKPHSPHGSQFAIVAADDDVVVDITPSVNTNTGKEAGKTFDTGTLKKGQVYYVWSGPNQGADYDFTGTVVKARNNKKIAVFNGNSHTNIPIEVRDRDHIYSQAMPINYWGKRFAITSSLTTIDGQQGFWERIDKIRVQAIKDGTVVKIDGQVAHTFDFVNGSDEDKKHFYEFDFGKQDDMTKYSGDGHTLFDGASHYIETSCPCAVHLFMTSNQYDHAKKEGVNTKYCNGDPSEIWVNPIEQKIDTLTFGNFETKQVKTHFVNIVTSKDNVASVRLDSVDISDKFEELNGNHDYMFARLNIESKTHTLTSDSGFIAHVYGFGLRESYGYPAGGNTLDLTAFITINGEEYHAESTNEICSEDTIHFGCKLNYEYDSIYWNFGDKSDFFSREEMNSITHYYKEGGQYDAYVLIYRHLGENDNCLDLQEYDSIPFIVKIGKYHFTIGQADVPCKVEGQPQIAKIPFVNEGNVDLKAKNVSITFDETAEADGFTVSDLTIEEQRFLITIHEKAEEEKRYGIHILIDNGCMPTDTTLYFELPIGNDVITQRYDYVLGLINDKRFEGQALSDFQWYRVSDSTAVEGQVSATLNLYDLTETEKNDEFYICYSVNKGQADETRRCACAKGFDQNAELHEFATEELRISASYEVTTDKIFVNADWNGKTDIECYAQWYDVSGRAVEGGRFDIPDGGRTINTPAANGLYLLRVVTAGRTRSFKFVINH